VCVEALVKVTGNLMTSKQLGKKVAARFTGKFHEPWCNWCWASTV